MEDFIEAGVKVLVAFVFLVVVVMLLVWLERRIVAFMQNRLGPTRAGPIGILQTLADGVKLMFKESMTPSRADVFLYLAAPVMALIPAFLIFLVIPVGAPITVGDTTYTLQVTDLNVGVLYILECRQWRSTRSRSRAGRPARSIRCSDRYVPRHR